MSKDKRYNVSLSRPELEILIEAVGAYKPRIRSKATRMAIKRGVNHQGKSHKRLSYIQTAARKLSEANEHRSVRLPEGMYMRGSYIRKKVEARRGKKD
jgi:hypothetical protein